MSCLYTNPYSLPTSNCRAKLTRVGIIAGVALAVAACSDSPTATARSDAPVAFAKGEFDGPKSVPTRGRILFHSTVTGAFELFAAYEDGSGLVRLTFSDGENMYGAYSPDGRKIAFISSREGSNQLYVMNADGSGAKRLTNLTGFFWTAAPPAWTPDGKKIAFSGGTGGPTVDDIYIMNANGSGLTTLIASEFSEIAPQFSPDGKRVAFSSNRSGVLEVWTANADGSEPTQLSECQVMSCSFPTWSPDGTRLAYTVGYTSVRIVPVISPSFVLATIAQASDPIWSPDGVRIALAPTQGVNMLVADANGANVKPVPLFENAVARPTSWTKQ